MKDNKDNFLKFISEVKLFNDSRNAKYEMLDENSNIVIITGKIIGEDTLEKIRDIGNKYELITLTDGLSVMYRNPGPSFTIK
ncbi:MAG: hypothetical protein HKM93_04210 [Desulfobacteraceae bacterium]|nr:hypothetical protein [Desulfobacteraceae bacterium]